MRCPSCNKFPSLEPAAGWQAEPEIQVAEDGKTAEVTATIRIVLNSGCCNDEMKDAEPDVTEEFAVPEEHRGHELSVGGDEPEPEDRYVGKGRGAKHFWGARAKVTVACETCGADDIGSVELFGEEQASAMNELN